MKLLRRSLLLVLSLATLAMLYFARGGDGVVARTRFADGTADVTLLSRTYKIDKIYQSMMGPFSTMSGVKLSDAGTSHLVWLTGLDSQLVDADGKTPISREFFCHSNLTFTPKQQSMLRTRTPSTDERLFTLIPGRLSISLPPGFGIPLSSDERIDYYTMSLNLNHQGSVVPVRFLTNVHFSEDTNNLKPLFRRCVYAFEPIGKASPHMAMCMGMAGDHPGAACGPMIGKAASSAFVASLGKTNTIHWLIPPGHYESHVNVTDQLELPFDTTAHYVTGHLHPFGRSIKLVDKTADQTIFTINAEDFSDKLGVAHMDEWSSTEGIELFKDHQYELLTTYHNPTDKPIDAMSILYVYALDKSFHVDTRAPANTSLAAR